ncbi:HbrB domain-containing protein [Phanerochaete sordida]|uniref:HbrB domain-containing protein n=1 Tax=Phanerochaete sordida TaxID=48140 RepID=A0A9P3GIY2_9APHY|nr:HbrB domain-containing protein [Phanerochaete sordida]
MRTPERTRRSLSQGDDTPRPAGLGVFHSVNPSPNSGSHDANSADHAHASKRLGFLGEKLLSSSSASSSALRAAASANASRSHSRADSANLLSLPRDATASPTPMAAAAGHSHHSKAHASPSKLVSREMHRLGNLAHLPVLNSSPSNVSLVPSTSTTLVGSSSVGDNPWAALALYILPLFNGEGLRVPIEDLNALVKRHIQSTVSASPSKALTALENDASELIGAGIVTLNSKLIGVEEEELVDRVVEIWKFFWDEVLPYVEGALLPLQTDPLLLSLYKIPKPHKPASPVGQNGTGIATPSFKTQQIDVRTIALRYFRDQIIYPVFSHLHDHLNALKERYPQTTGPPPRLQQMLLVLLSQRTLPVLYSLTVTPPPPPAGEEAVQALLRAIRTPLVQTSPDKPHLRATGAPSFLSAGVPRDRRGRIARKPERAPSPDVPPLPVDDEHGEDTPRLGAAFVEGRELLESLKSPDPESAQRASMGGWGLGLGGEDRAHEDYDKDEDLNWDQAQAVVERMVGMNPPI